MKDSLKKGKNMEKENFFLRMAQYMKDKWMKITSMDKECIFGLITGNISENGKETKCMEKEP
jgi:hypothetical protein